MRALLKTNLTYGLVLPVIELFIGAYIIRNSSDLSLIMVFQLAQGTGIPLTFILNNLLLSRFSIASLYSFGMVLSGISMALMMLLPELDIFGVAAAGLIMGFSYGFFWANRSYLALTNTKDANRNYFYGLETFFYTISFVLVPFLAGSFILLSQKNEWFQNNLNGAYYMLTAFVFILTLIASYHAHLGKFRSPKKSRFIYFSFHPLWYKMLRMAVLKGVAQAYIITAPVILIMRFFGDEGSLGMIQSSGAMLSAALLYFLGRKTNSKHRLKIFLGGLVLFALGAMINMIFYSTLTVLIFIACLVFARPLIDVAYFPIQLRVIEFLSAREGRNQFAYIFSHEIGLYLGRIAGCGLFIILARYFTEDTPMRYALPVISILQMLSVLVAKSIMNDPAWREPDAQRQNVAVETLKEPIEL
jgi:MFS transporter, YQGE family, putative transporter